MALAVHEILSPDRSIPLDETRSQRSKRLAKYPTYEEAPPGYSGPYRPDNYYRYLDRSSYASQVSSEPGETWEQRTQRLNLLPTCEEAPPGYSGPYRPDNYDDHLEPEREQQPYSEVVVFGVAKKV